MLQLVCIQTVIGPSLELTSLAWARDTVSHSWRTFVAFLDGTVAEVVWRQGSVSHSTDSYGGVVWSLAASPASAVKPGFAHVLAAACDDGSVRLFGCEGGEPGLVAERVLARLEGRLLAACWHAGGSVVAVAGTAGHIHLLDAVTGRENLRITASPSAARTVTVWRLLSLSDGTLVSGDSDGAVAMWDGRFGTMLARFTQHKADVLALAASEDDGSVFAAGVDSQVVQFARVPGASGRPDTWAYTHYKRPHTHDVRSLALLPLGPDRGAVLLSGGVDAQLIAYPAGAFLQEHPTRLCKCPQRPACQATSPGAAAPPRLLVSQSDTLDVWQLAEAASAASAASREGEPLELHSAPRHLARIRLKGSAVAAAALSPSGGFVVASTPAGTRAYQLGPAAAGAAAVSRLRLAAAAEEAAVAVAATDSHLVLAPVEGGLLVVELPGGAVVATLPAKAGGLASLAAASAGSGSGSGTEANAWRAHCAPFSALAVSPDGALVAAAGGAGIALYRLPGLEPVGRPLRPEGAVTALGFSRDGRLLAATTAACALLLWDTADARAAPWSADNAEAATAAISRLPGAPTSISFCPTPAGAGAGAAAAGAAAGAEAGSGGAEANGAPAAALPYKLVVAGPGGMVHLDLSRPLEPPAAAKQKRGRLRPDQRPAPEDRPESRGSNGRVIRTTHPAVWVGHVGSAELLLLEKPWEEVLAGLPPPLYTHRYGS
ncbi:hypothetical protein HYH03_018659 [Edaphochlamys debaryana]|uniref:Uncharacterized protein n=1 Tax=Edaphochlamys debaryana TaxID=47281 RepID=A0A836BP99_9CHLO|nr:hypothetical protein HYH03_018659 [Edaphochlamys debaryana]|eukprot:KAG2482398.1 hypothetical protein HYH03_018659 [Edaphochlamys debaryana]